MGSRSQSKHKEEVKEAGAVRGGGGGAGVAGARRWWRSRGSRSQSKHKEEVRGAGVVRGGGGVAKVLHSTQNKWEMSLSCQNLLHGGYKAITYLLHNYQMVALHAWFASCLPLFTR
jgi:hypothetical protein